MQERWKVLYSPRTLLKGEQLSIELALRTKLRRRSAGADSLRTIPGFSPHEVHKKQSTYLGWVLPTLRTSEVTVLQIVGLDAAVVSRASSSPRRRR